MCAQPSDRRNKRNKLIKDGNYITHSDIMRRRGGDNITSFRNFGANGR